MGPPLSTVHKKKKRFQIEMLNLTSSCVVCDSEDGDSHLRNLFLECMFTESD